MSNLEQEVRRLVAGFRCLKDWTVEVDEEAEYKGQCSVGSDIKAAVIYGWTGKRPIDYALHEVLHVAYRASNLLGRDGEETFIQDICQLLHPSEGKICQHCGRWFIAGRGQEKRADAIACSGRCRVGWWRKRRKKAVDEDRS